ncbi:MAG TPA: pyridoxal phosphate-dependent aminotransferase [Steroidobacteraceae bacterium]|nr:pyridoxal phosphate-dependent aminotransferase [Steroidobacteraceae bacterium]
MTVSVSRRVQRVKPSPTLAVTARAARLKAEGKDVIGLGAGEPDFDTPVPIAQAGIDAIRSGFTRYTNVEGINELKDAIIAKFARDNGIQYERSQILVSSGAKQTIFNLCMAVLDKDDEAIIPAPYWVSYPDMVLLADGQPVMPFAGAAQGYKITARQLAAAITPKTRLLLLNSPCNPTGAAYTRAELRALGEVLLEHPRIVIGTDDMYEKIYWGAEPFCSLLTAVPELYGRTVTINGVSKAYAMTGWRIGYCGGPKELIAAMATIQGQSTSNASSISQKAAAAALAGDQACVATMNEAFKQRHDYVVAALNGLPGISCLPGSGTFYAFADVTKAMAALGCNTDAEFAELLLNEGGVAVVPGSGFGAPGHMRISFACSLQTLEQAIERMARVLATASAVATKSPSAILDGAGRPAGLGAGMGPGNTA